MGINILEMTATLELQHRFIQIDSPKEKSDRLEFSFSSEEPVKRYFGDEVLDHGEGSVDLTRLNSGSAPLLFNHDPNVVLGVVERAWVQDRKGRATIKWATNAKAQEVRKDVEAGILRGISTGYVITEAEQEDETTRAVSWQPHELSICPIPADFKSIGIGRALPTEHSTPKEMSNFVTDYMNPPEDLGSLPLDPQEQQRRPRKYGWHLTFDDPATFILNR